MRNAIKAQSGNTAVELALVLPLLMLILLGTADFGRGFAQWIAIQQAARSGTQYASVDTTHYLDTAGTETAALADIPNIAGATATATSYCTCGWSGQFDCSVVCSSKRQYMQVVVQANFTTIAPYPGIPATTAVTAKSIMRLK